MANKAACGAGLRAASAALRCVEARGSLTLKASPQIGRAEQKDEAATIPSDPRLVTCSVSTEGDRQDVRSGWTVTGHKGKPCGVAVVRVAAVVVSAGQTSRCQRGKVPRDGSSTKDGCRKHTSNRARRTKGGGRAKSVSRRFKEKAGAESGVKTGCLLTPPIRQKQRCCCCAQRAQRRARFALRCPTPYKTCFDRDNPLHSRNLNGL